MEITNENFINLKYNTELDRLELKHENSLLRTLKKHKMISIILAIFVMFSCLNLFLIINFVTILESVI